MSTLLRKNEETVAAAEKDKEATEEHYKDLLFDDFFHIWNLNEPLDLSFLSEDEQAEELAICERRAQEEAAEEAAAYSVDRGFFFRFSSRFCSVTEMVGEPLIGEVADVSMDDLPL